MSNVINMVGGGGGGYYPSLFAYGDDLTSSGSATLSKTGKTYNGTWSSKTISGVATQGWSFPKIELGTYTLETTQGAKTVQQSVVVEMATEYEVEVEINKLYLYKLGNECTSVTGGWSSAGYSYYTNNWAQAIKNTDNLYFTNSNKQIGTTYKVNCNGYSKLCAQSTSTGENKYYLSLRLESSKTINASTGVTADSIIANGTAAPNLEIDISNYNEEYYVYMGGDVYNSTVTVTKVWLE